MNDPTKALSARILGTGSLLPGRAVTTAEVGAMAAPDREPAKLEALTGIKTRRWTEPGAKMAPLGAEALRRALDAAAVSPSELRRLIFVTSTGGDYLVPATANAVAQALGIEGTCDCFDLNNACMGFMTAFDLGVRSVATGLYPVGIVVVELLSHHITPSDPRPYLVFGDAAGAVVLGPGRPGEGIRGVSLGNNGAHVNAVTLAHSRLSGKAETIQFAISNRKMNQLAFEQIPENVREVLAQAGENLADIEWIVAHQPNGPMLEALVKAAGVDPSKVIHVVQEIGSTGAASIPVSLDRLMRTGSVRPGDRILIFGVGAGAAYGAILYRVAP